MRILNIDEKLKKSLFVLFFLNKIFCSVSFLCGDLLLNLIIIVGIRKVLKFVWCFID